MKKIVCISDMHGTLPKIEKCDILIIAGDICPADDHSILRQLKFINGPFKDWLDEVPAINIVATFGNHDFIGEQNLISPLLRDDLRWTLLIDKAAEIQGLKFWGSPWQLWFYDWAFNAPKYQSEEFLEKKYSLIPDDTDVIISHRPPKEYGDQTMQNDNVGSVSLLKRIDAIAPKLVVCGHIHFARGEYYHGKTKIINASILDEAYKFAHQPITVEL